MFLAKILPFFIFNMSVSEMLKCSLTVAQVRNSHKVTTVTVLATINYLS